jgi:hypothetical protein
VRIFFERGEGKLEQKTDGMDVDGHRSIRFGTAVIHTWLAVVVAGL